MKTKISELEVGQRYYHVFTFPLTVKVTVKSVKKFLMLSWAELEPVYSHDGGKYIIFGLFGYTYDDFIKVPSLYE